MPAPLMKQKVVCYIVRDGQLLVFRHLDEPWDESGLQVPAGTIEPGETPEVAAVREASEETGLTALRLVRKVGESQVKSRGVVYEVDPSSGVSLGGEGLLLVGVAGCGFGAGFAGDEGHA